MANHRVLITTAYLEPGGEVDQLLTSAGCDVVFARPQDRDGDDELTSALERADAVIAGNDAFTKDRMKAAQSLKIIARTGVGYDGIDINAASELGIRVCNTPGANQRSVAELTLGLILACARGTVGAAIDVQAGHWVQSNGVEVAGKRLGIIGLGSIGRNVATLASGVGMTILAFDTAADETFDVPDNIEMCSLQDLLQRSDFVSIHVALTPETRHLIDKEALAMMRPSSYLINTSRGAVINEEELAVAIADKQVAGAALDVLESEPPAQDHPFRNLPSVVVTPHIAGATHEARALSSHMAAHQILDYFNDRPVAHLINGEDLS